jgi:precorrin-2 dehydrogenase/sirohydrochlorin ferrochelatase
LPHYYPVYLDLKAKKCVVVGGGEVAERKVQALLAAGAEVCLISPVVTPQISELGKAGKLTFINREYHCGDLEGACLVIGATDNEAINRRVAQDAEQAGILVNIVDVPKLCNFIVPSKVQRGDLVLSISTGGKSPALTKKIRQQLEQLYGAEYAEHVALLGKCREQVLQRIPDIAKRRQIFQALVDSELIDLLKQGNKDKIRKLVAEIVGFEVEGI